MNNLKQLQSDFTKAIFAELDSDSSIVQAIIEDSIPGHRRLNIYKHSIFYSLTEALKATYPVIYKLVGSDFFTVLAENYIVKHPSRSGNLHDFGRALSDFIHEFEPANDLPYLADVAKLEWAFHRVFHEAFPTSVVSLSQLQSIPADTIDSIIFAINPASRLIRSDYPVIKIWQSNQEGVGDDSTISLDEGGDNVLVIRNSLDIEFHQLSKGEFEFLQAIASKKTFATACEKALEVETVIDIPQLLHKHIHSETIVGFQIAINDLQNR